MKEEKDEEYIKVCGWMVDLGLSGNELLLYALIYGFTQYSQEHKCTASLDYMAARIGIRQRQTVNILQSLEKKGFISKERTRKNNTNRCEYMTLKDHSANIAPCNQGILQELHHDTAKIAECHTANFAESHTANIAPNNKDIDRKEEEKKCVCESNARACTHTQDFNNNESKADQAAEPELPWPGVAYKWEGDGYYFNHGKYKRKDPEGKWKEELAYQKRMFADFQGWMAKFFPNCARHERPLTLDGYLRFAHDYGKEKTWILLRQLDSKKVLGTYMSVIDGLRRFADADKAHNQALC